MTEQEVIADIRSHYSDEDKGDFDVPDLIARHGFVIEAIMYSRLFWPEFTEILGCVLLKERIDTEEAKTRLSKAISEMMDLSEVEESFNLVELPSDVFFLTEDTTDEQVEHLAGCLVEMWRSKLQLSYPNARLWSGLFLQTRPEERSESHFVRSVPPELKSVFRSS